MALKVVGLGPSGLERLAPSTIDLLLDPEFNVVVRTLSHPAAVELAQRRPVTSCDDLYESASDIDEVYAGVVRRVLHLARQGPTIYAVPGSPLLGEFAVAGLRASTEIEVIPSESFLDAILAALGYDPLDRGLRLLNAQALPDPLLIDGPTLIAHLDQPVLLADAVARLSRVVDEESIAVVVIDAGGSDERVIESHLDQVDFRWAGLRTSLFIDPTVGGLPGVIATMDRLRRECPWDRAQTHQSLVKNLIEETHELVDAIASEAEGAIEDELGDVLLQVLFHSVISRQEGGFGLEDVAENLRQKLVRRHPHVFGEVTAETPEVVKANWEQIKQTEGKSKADSALDGVPAGMPALERAAKLQRKAATVGFDWPEAEPVLAKIDEELSEVRLAVENQAGVEEEIGDMLFSVVNLARHLGVDPELALTGTIQRFIDRFSSMERMGPLEGLSLEELDQRWEIAKARRS